MLVSESLRRLWSTKCHHPLFLPTLHCSFQGESKNSHTSILTSHRMKYGTVTLQQWTAKASLMSPQNPVTAVTHLTPSCHDLWFCATGLVDNGAAAICWLSSASLWIRHITATVAEGVVLFGGDTSDFYAWLSNSNRGNALGIKEFHV